jgi:hypothetical protein
MDDNGDKLNRNTYTLEPVKNNCKILVMKILRCSIKRSQILLKAGNQ